MNAMTGGTKVRKPVFLDFLAMVVSHLASLSKLAKFVPGQRQQQYMESKQKIFIISQ